MQQLRMLWTNDGIPAKEPVLSAGLQVVNFTELNDAKNIWLDLVQYGLSSKREDESYYEKIMVHWPHYQPDKCFFLLENGRAVATATVICDYEKADGYIHMVVCHPDSRGKGFGTILNEICLYTLKAQNMKTASLTTDDARIPAIKSYLRAGFVPDVSTADFKERWDKVMKQIRI
ncbi:MAG: GNAT family N-acetyltransferase [Firmicutes bacterium]|nr:GNAT family N-acetyltransferase [Bacillota bacterium]